MRTFFLPVIFFFVSMYAHPPVTAQAGPEAVRPTHLDEHFHGLEWRCIGPYRGGRANAIAGVIGDRLTYYAGYTGGGVWKTEDGGINWYNLSDGYFSVGSIGDIAVSESDPNVIYVGSGEHAVRGVMTSYGDGVYKSTDAGKTWQHQGLNGTRHIANVVVHPRNDEIVYVGAQGAVHGPSNERGVYKSTDGGQTWKRTLYINDSTGVSSLVMDMTNPRILYAATWEHRRYPWKVVSGGPGSAIYKSVDSGESWTRLTKGLPEQMGKIGLSVSRANPDRVFAIIETDKERSGMYRSDDGGETWELTSNNQIITARSWYYMEVFADPGNENVVYALNAPLMKSIDGGKTFASMRVIHGDCHGFWINPHDSDNIAMAEDGGATITYNGGRSWSSFNNQPTAQFYRITADRQVPFWVYGGQQDNFSVCIPSRSKNYGILSTDWFNGPGCESAMVAMDDPYDPRILYGGCFNGRIGLLDIETRESKDIMPYPMTNLGYMPKDMKYRFNWNAPLINSPHDPRVMYYGGNVLFKSTNGGLQWDPISPDLTRNDSTKQQEGGGPFT
ncbi:MAG: glycosyl hydrolase, partial [Saprospiraceae bacterium]|nr:glycosyl hydrolase [Saprospiraceae bacterium]